MMTKKSNKLFLIKSFHTIIYIVMVAAIFYVLYAGIAKTYNVLLYVSLGLLAVESVVFVGNGMRCPLTKMAQDCGTDGGYVGDTFLPEKFTRYTFRFLSLIHI